MKNVYGMERVKQRIMDTIIQMYRTHRLPAYGLLLAAPQEPESHRLPMQWPDKGKHVPEMAFDKVMVRSMLGCLKKPTFGAR